MQLNYEDNGTKTLILPIRALMHLVPTIHLGDCQHLVPALYIVLRLPKKQVSPTTA